MMVDDQKYNEWIANRQTIEPSDDLTDRVMEAVQHRVQRNRYQRLADRMNESWAARLAACLAALLVGSLPFWLVPLVTQSPLF